MIRTGLTPLLFASFLLAADEKPKETKDVSRILYAMPLAVKTGAKTKITLRGTKLEGVTEVKAPDSMKVKLADKGRKATVPNNYPAAKLGDAECEIELELPKDFSGEMVEITLVAPKGESKYKLAVAKEINVEKEPNDGFAQAQKLTLPITIDGTIGKEKDVDVFLLEGKSGQKIAAEILAARLGSPADLRLTLYNAEYHVLAESDNTRGEPDPRISFTLPRDGTYYLGVQESNDLGGPQYGYRLLVK